jgi:hypothetical protein
VGPVKGRADMLALWSGATGCAFLGCAFLGCAFLGCAFLGCAFLECFWVVSRNEVSFVIIILLYVHICIVLLLCG